MSDQNNNQVVITIRDIYDEVKSLSSKVEAALSLNKRVEDQEARLRKLEAWRNAMPASLAVAIISLVVAIIEKVS